MAAGGQAFGSGKVQLWDVKVKNTGDKARNLSLFSYLEFSFHHIMIDNQNYQMSLYCAGASYEDGIIEEDLFYEEEGYQYFTADFAPDGFDCMRDKFLGTYNTETNPAAVIAGQCFSSYEKGGNHCGRLLIPYWCLWGGFLWPLELGDFHQFWPPAGVSNML